MRSWCSHGGMCLLFISQHHPALCCATERGFLHVTLCLSTSTDRGDWLIDLAGAAGFKTTTLAASAQGNRERAGWVNPRREETTLVICQLRESYHKLEITIFIVFKWKMWAEPGRSILNTVLCFSLRAQSKSPFPFMLSFSSHTSCHQLTKTILCLWGKRGSLPTYLPPPWKFTIVHLHWNVRSVPCTKPLVPPTAVSLSPGSTPLSEEQWNPFRLCSCSSYLLPARPPTFCTETFPEVTFLLVKKPEN